MPDLAVDTAITWIGRDLQDPVDVEAMTKVVASVNSHIATCWPLAYADTTGSGEFAMLLLASRWYSRRNSPDGLVGFGEMGASTIRNLDPDVRDLLKAFSMRTVG